jgi:hypothetical protein
LRNFPLIGSSSMSRSNVLNLKVLGPIFWWIWYGHSKRFWSLVCFPFTSLSLSHLRGISPYLNSLLPTYDLSNHLLTISWCCIQFLLDFSLSSSSLRSMFNLCCITRHYLSWIDWAICNKGKKVCVGRMACSP